MHGFDHHRRHLGGDAGPKDVMLDSITIITGGGIGSDTGLFLGSYNVTAVPTSQTGRSVTVQYTVENTSTLASALHVPFYDRIPGYAQIDSFLNGIPQIGPMAPKEQTITWSEQVDLGK